MTEKQLRQKFVDTAVSYLGTVEGSSKHKEIVDTYNSNKPLARGYALQYDDAWCAGSVSAWAIMCGITDIVPTEVGCGPMITLFQKMGRWQENDAYVPEIGDVVFYDWADDGKGDNQGSPDHVGVVTFCDGKTIRVIEGNRYDSVTYRLLDVDGQYIRGYGVPDFASKTTEVEPEQTETITNKEECNVDLPVLKKGSMGASVKALQLLLIGNKCSCGWYGADGDFGSATEKAVTKFQTNKKITVDGIVGSETWSHLLK